jgi:ATP-dependent DNA helicase RecQ
VSTNAFGMGIDKPDVRSVIHIDPPDNIEAYFQEAGRGGRDEKKAYAILLYGKGDKASLDYTFEISFPELKEVRQVYRALGSYFQLGIGSGEGESYDFDIIEFSKTYRFDDQLKVLSCLKILEQAGWLALSESIFIPSSVLVVVNRDELYNFQLKHKDIDLTAKSLTRVYPHIFSQPVFINEKAMSHFLKIREDELIKKLQYLHNERIIEYVPQKEKPQLTFLKERMNAEDITFDHQLYKFRKERQQYRIAKIIEYCESERCRSVMLMAYFGQKNAQPCGVCDYCLKNPSAVMSKEDFDRYREKIFFLLRKEQLSLDQVVNSFATNRQANIIKTIEYLLDEGTLIKIGEHLKLS